MSVSADLATIWAFIIAFAVFAYVVLDGFDLGIGILFPAFGVGEERDQAMNSIAPVWDGNETWLVLGGGGLLAAFPLAYAIILPALYPPLIAMLLALIFRGVAFEFRWRDPRHRAFWDLAFTGGSFIAAFAQGVTLGALLQGIRVTGRAYGGGWLDWLTPFSLLTGASVVAAYALLGATWLIWKTEGGTQAHAFRLARHAGGATVAAMLAVSFATPFLDFRYFERWFHLPDIFVLAPIPVAAGVLALLLRRSVRRGSEAAPFWLTIGLFAMCFLGLGIALYPFIIPDALTIWDAAAPEKSQLFMLAGASVLIPTILIYTAWAYWVFRGKVGPDGYH
jgi:cytochrome d ubiquinol oxidase subunit II